MADPPDWKATYAEAWAQTLLRTLATTYPYAAQHTSSGPDDVDVTPARLHPAFHGCLDWHSSVHMQWSAVRLLTVAPEHLSAATRQALVGVLDERLSAEHLAVESAYLFEHPGFERPYGWGWAAMLASACTMCVLPAARGWALSSRLVYEAIAELVTHWMPRLAYPVRHGEHFNTAFGLALVHQAATSLGDIATGGAIEREARRWFADDRDYPASWEPGGSDFLSPALCEADLMRRVLPHGDFTGWLAAFMPGVGTADDPLLETPEVLDRTDGKAVHLYGLALSRAWQLRLLAPALDNERRGRVEQATARQVRAIEREIVEGDFMSTHWLVSFALLASTA